MLRSRESDRCRYPASRIIVAAGSASVPLFGSATRSIRVLLVPCCVLQELVNVFERDLAPEHEDLDAVEQLGDLLGQRVVGLVLGGQPHLAGLLEQLLALRVHPRVESRDRARALRAGGGLLGQLDEQLVEGLHVRSLLTTSSSYVDRVDANSCTERAAPGAYAAPGGSPNGRSAHYGGRELFGERRQCQRPTAPSPGCTRRPLPALGHAVGAHPSVGVPHVVRCESGQGATLNTCRTWRNGHLTGHHEHGSTRPLGRERPGRGVLHRKALVRRDTE